MKVVLFSFLFLIFLVSCRDGESYVPGKTESTEEFFRTQRLRMVQRQIAARGVTDQVVLETMEKVPRHEFVPNSFRNESYADSPLPIGREQTISQPYIVALMTELLQLKPGARVLEIGTGCGYQTAVLAEIAGTVYSIEIVRPLCITAQKNLESLNYKNIQLRCGDGYQGWPTEAPFDGIIVAAAPREIPPPLLQQLAPGGRLVIPVGVQAQTLKVITRKQPGDGFSEEDVIPVRFVPMTGRAQKSQ